MAEKESSGGVGGGSETSNSPRLEILKIQETLKTLIFGRGLRYEDLSKHLGVSLLCEFARKKKILPLSGIFHSETLVIAS